MAIDPPRSTGGRIIQFRERPAMPPRSNGAASTDSAAGSSSGAGSTSASGTVSEADAPAGYAPESLNLRKTLVLARIQQDYYQQAHVRERIVDSLLQFLDEE